MSQVLVRRAVKSDCPLIYKLAQEAATCRKMPINPQLTSEDLERDGFSSSPRFHCIVAESEGCLVGFAIYYFTYSTWEGKSVCMEDLYVAQMENCMIVATKMWRKLVEVALELGCSRCNITVLKDDVEMRQFYESHNTVNLTEAEDWHFFRMNKEATEEFVKGTKAIEGVTIRESTTEDCVGIRQQIQDLADYEKMPEGPQIDAEVLKKDGFGDDVFYKSYVAEEKGKLVGYTLFVFTYNWEGPGVYMEDLYVAPSHRGRGIGMALWRKVIQVSMALQGIRCDFAVLNWNLPSIDFYKSKGASDMTQKCGFLFYRMTKDDMEEFVK